jgi:hypothetical protein
MFLRWSRHLRRHSTALTGAPDSRRHRSHPVPPPTHRSVALTRQRVDLLCWCVDLTHWCSPPFRQSQLLLCFGFFCCLFVYLFIMFLFLCYLSYCLLFGETLIFEFVLVYLFFAVLNLDFNNVFIASASFWWLLLFPSERYIYACFNLYLFSFYNRLVRPFEST